MKKIESFQVDHTRLNRGIYVSRKDKVGNETVTSFDIRMKIPNQEPVLDVPAIHTIEHIGATFLRSHEKYSEETIYFGPMGCRTGFYLILKGDLSSEEIIPMIKDLFDFVAGFEGEIPGATPVECGNYLSMDLPMAKFESEQYFTQTLKELKQENLNYPS